MIFPFIVRPFYSKQTKNEITETTKGKISSMLHYRRRR